MEITKRNVQYGTFVYPPFGRIQGCYNLTVFGVGWFYIGSPKEGRNVDEEELDGQVRSDTKSGDGKIKLCTDYRQYECTITYAQNQR